MALTIKQIQGMANQIVDSLPILREISTPQEHMQALGLIEEFIDDYDRNLLLIESLTASIKHYEDETHEFKEFNKSVAKFDPPASLISALFSQHRLASKTSMSLEAWTAAGLVLEDKEENLDKLLSGESSEIRGLMTRVQNKLSQTTKLTANTNDVANSTKKR